MNNSKLIADAFWNYYRDDLSSGVPVYFNFTRNLISNLVASELKLHSPEQGYESFSKAVSSFVEIQGERVLIKDSLFVPSVDGRSAVILLIAIQVEAAEHMSESQNEYSANAYYPPLRKLFSESLGVARVLPFSEFDFKRMWDVFRNEVLSFNDKAIVTFDLTGSGMNVNRIFPLSQALLNQRDLIKLASTHCLRGPKIPIDQLGETYWRKFFIENSRFLSNRGSSCVANETLRNAVVVQLSLFLARFDFSQLAVIETKIKENVSALGITIVEDDDLFSPEDSKLYIKFFSSNSGNSELERFKGLNILDQCLAARNYTVLRLVPGGWEGGADLSFEGVLGELGFVAKTTNFLAHIETYLGMSHLQFKQESIFETPGIFFYRITDERAVGLEVRLFQGKFSKNGDLDKLSFAGGIRADGRGNNFFLDFPPIELRYKGKVVGSSEMIVVNYSKMTVEDFLSSIKRYGEIQFQICFGEARTVLKLRKPIPHNKFAGYKVVDRFIHGRPRFVNEDDQAIIGYGFQNIGDLITFNRNDFLDFFVQESHEFSTATPEEVKHILDSVYRSMLGPTQKKYVEIFINQTATAPKKILRRIRRAS